jgi:hypothetical protein
MSYDEQLRRVDCRACQPDAGAVMTFLKSQSKRYAMDTAFLVSNYRAMRPHLPREWVTDFERALNAFAVAVVEAVDEPWPGSVWVGPIWWEEAL